MRVFMGLVEIAGYYSNLKKGFDELGIESTFVDLSDHPFQYGGKDDNISVRLAKLTAKKRREAPRTTLLPKLFWIGCDTAAQIILLVWAVTHFDTFIFGFGTSFFNNQWDLPCLKWLGKKVICYVAHGAEARPPYIDGTYLSPAGQQPALELYLRLPRVHKQRLQQIERYADLVIGSPLTGHFLSKRFIIFFHLGLPYNLSRAAQVPVPPAQGSTVRILHSPSHPALKGTPYIRQAIHSLQNKGYAIEFIEIVGKPNAVVLEELTRCDFVIDQLYSDTPMAGFAAEAAWFSKPAIVGGYDWELLRQIVPAEIFPPSQICHADQVEAAIEQLITDQNYRLDLGRRARQFVETHWTPRQVAEGYVRLITGDVPKDWWFDPKNTRYVHGAGLSEAHVKALLRTIITSEGREALGLVEKPELERLFVVFANTDAA